ncbi:MAG: hypothetical protein BGO14_08660 [Chlamydiales bacterium 38-26]|nr:hypothetical protein [Chlamydiales bacterium]OJV11059.1 MAG: hypothetical protein BGO14_08660 [Chlamydiales bacterium 38-26]
MSDEPKIPENKLAIVSHNFQNVYAALHRKDGLSILVPSLWGHQIYCSTAGWRGRLLRILYRWMKPLLGEKFLHNKLLRALEYTQRCFLNIVEFRHSFFDPVYQDYLRQRAHQLTPEESLPHLHNARKQIQLFFQATYPLTKLMHIVHKKKNPDQLMEPLKTNLSVFISHYFPGSIYQNQQPFYHEKTHLSVKNMIKVMSLEGIISNEIPQQIFQKTVPEEVEHKISISPKDEETLITFVQNISLAKKRGNFQVKLFYNSLKSLACYLRNVPSDEIKNLQLLVINLIKEGCILLDEIDEKHLSWRKTLNTGDCSFSPENKFYFLNENSNKVYFRLKSPLAGAKIESKKDNLYEVFEIEGFENCENYLMSIGPNRFCFTYQEIMRREYYWALETPEIVYIHPEGRFAVVKKIPHSLDSIQWHSLSSGPLEVRDKPYADALLVLIEFFIQAKTTPKNMHPDYLKFDQQGRLKSTKNCIPSEKIDTMALEEVIYQICQGRLPVYLYLIKPLVDAKFNKNILDFFSEVMENALEDHPVSMQGLAKTHKISDTKILQRASQIHQTAYDMKKNCFHYLLTQYSDNRLDKKKLDHQINKSMIELFHQQKTFGRFWQQLTWEKLALHVEENILHFCQPRH